MSRLVNALKQARDPDIAQTEEYDDLEELSEELELDLDLSPPEPSLPLKLNDQFEVPESQDKGLEALSVEELYDEVSKDYREGVAHTKHSGQQLTRPVQDPQEHLQSYVDSLLIGEATSQQTSDVDDAVQGESQDQTQYTDDQTLSIEQRFEIKKQQRLRVKKIKLLGFAAMFLLGASYFVTGFLDSGAQTVKPPGSEQLVLESSTTEPDESAGDLDTYTIKNDPDEQALRGVLSNSAADSQEVSLSSAPARQFGTKAASSETESSGVAIENFEGLISITSSTKRSPVSDLLQQAYLLMQQSNYDSAEAIYQRILAAQPVSIEALEGMGTIAFRRNNYELAEHYFYSAVNADGSNLYAVAMLKKTQDLMGKDADIPSFSHHDFASDDPADYFALGHAFAVKKQWPRAQEFFFQALALDKNNSEYAYHLAVSLDHMGKTELARNYYELALTAGSNSLPERDFEIRARIKQIDAS